MKVKVSEATGPLLCWATAKALGHETHIPAWAEEARVYLVGEIGAKPQRWQPDIDWSQGGPVLNRARISRTIDHSGLWIAFNGYNYADAKEHMQCHSEELVAGLRCFVASKLGDEVDVPEELL